MLKTLEAVHAAFALQAECVRLGVLSKEEEEEERRKLSRLDLPVEVLEKFDGRLGNVLPRRMIATGFLPTRERLDLWLTGLSTANPGEQSTATNTSGEGRAGVDELQALSGLELPQTPANGRVPESILGRELVLEDDSWKEWSMISTGERTAEEVGFRVRDGRVSLRRSYSYPFLRPGTLQVS